LIKIFRRELITPSVSSSGDLKGYRIVTWAGTPNEADGSNCDRKGWTRVSASGIRTTKAVSSDRFVFILPWP